MRNGQTRSPDSLRHRSLAFSAHGDTCRHLLFTALQSGFQLLELSIALAIVAIAAAVAVPSHSQHIDTANDTDAAAGVVVIAQAIEAFYTRNERDPDSLAEIGPDTFQDPWGKPYRYLRIAGAGLRGKGALRKDKKLNPVNSDFDLDSMGKDGDSMTPFTAKPSWDDVVRANNGRFVGLAADY